MSMHNDMMVCDGPTCETEVSNPGRDVTSVGWWALTSVDPLPPDAVFHFCSTKHLGEFLNAHTK